MRLNLWVPRSLKELAHSPTSPGEFEAAIKDPIRRNAFFLARLPALSFFGIDVLRLDAGACEVNLPFTWRTQNPFGSVYFAAQASAAELATGLLVLRGVTGPEKMSMLVTRMSGEFVKKAKSAIAFTCIDGAAIQQAIETAKSGGDSTVTTHSVGRTSDQVEVARFQITWAIKSRTSP